MNLEVNQSAPAFSLADETGKIRTLEEFAGRPLVLYFYPKDDTPGCTKEACSFRDDYHVYEEAGVTILGVSPDSVKTHAGIARKQGLPFTLLSDTEKTLLEAAGSVSARYSSTVGMRPSFENSVECAS